MTRNQRPRNTSAQGQRGRGATLRAAAVATAAALSLVGCSDGAETSAAGHGSGAEESVEHYPVAVSNCGQPVEFEEDPERLVLLKAASVPALYELGVLDRAVARAGAYPEEQYDDDVVAQLQDIPQLSERLDPTGHLQISRDIVLAQEPDLVLGEVDGLQRDSLERFGIPLIEEPALCSSGGEETPSFDSVSDQLRVYAEIFNVEARAEEAISALEDRVEAATTAGEQGQTRRAAVLYPTVGGGSTYAYGTGSMAHPQLEAAGFTNVFEDVDQRVFEVSPEELIARDPEVLVLLYSQGDPEQIIEAVADLPGAQSIAAVRTEQMLAQPMNLTEPATPLAVEGLERIVERFS
ncbi:ABC transporter substrate-binding protein [Citricoccus muralis]|uniref:ABC transporter substrate-binding protein n=1 Tax=Citricoccus muralis TaxID=169134 RepID=A0ABY8H8N6_9MICC|nr:ABC transporter substrate-binding protein [Citricoccus muralis]WFP17065.1 ABC transporter substrate-binding protein [Citricoccus muralis]